MIQPIIHMLNNGKKKHPPLLKLRQNVTPTELLQRGTRRWPLAGKPAIGVNDDLGIALHPLVELFICRLGLINANLMRHHEAGSCLSGNDQVSQLPVVGLDVTLACAKGESLLTMSAPMPLMPEKQASTIPSQRAFQS